MNGLIAKFLPWAAASVAVIGLVAMFAAKQRAIGEATAYRHNVEQLQRQFTADSVNRSNREKARQAESRQIEARRAEAAVKQQMSARRADSTIAALRLQLQPQQQATLDVIAAEHAKERAYFELREAAWQAQLKLKSATIVDLEANVADLQRLNSGLKLAAKRGTSGTSRLIPFALGVGASAVVIALLRP